MPLIPWDMLRTNSLRAVIKDLGLSDFTNDKSRRTELVKVLQDVQADGLEAVMQRLERERSPTMMSNFSHPRARRESPELEYLGGPDSPSSPTTRSHRRPVVEIPSHHPRAGPSRARARATTRTEASSASTRPSRPRSRSRSSPASDSDARPEKRLRGIPPPSYAILYEQQRLLGPVSAEPYPRLRPHEMFDGVHLPAAPPRPPPRPRTKAPPGIPAGMIDRAHENGEDDEDEDGIEVEVEVEVCGSGSGGSSRGRGGTRGGTAGTATEASTSASISRRLEAVVVTSSAKTIRAQWRRDSSADHEMEVDE